VSSIAIPIHDEEPTGSCSVRRPDRSAV